MAGWIYSFFVFVYFYGLVDVFSARATIYIKGVYCGIWHIKAVIINFTLKPRILI